MLVLKLERLKYIFIAEQHFLFAQGFLQFPFLYFLSPPPGPPPITKIIPPLFKDKQIMTNVSEFCLPSISLIISLFIDQI